MSDETPDAAEATPAPRPVNPLLVPRRRETIQLYRDDIAKQLDDLVDKMNELSVEIDDLQAAADEGGGPPKRMGKKSPLVLKREERRALAVEYDRLAEQPSVPMVFEEPSADDYTAAQNEHPPREDDRLDQLRGWNGDTFPTALVKLCLVEPEVTDEQFAEFRASVTAYNWRRKILPTVQSLTDAEPDLPKAFAVSALQQMDAPSSKRQPATERPPELSGE